MQTPSENPEQPIIAVIGVTGGGKSAWAMQLARKVSGEIICADSRTVYKGLNIGTAKPSQADRAMVPHWGLDLVEPDQFFSLYHYQQYTWQAIKDIRAHGHIPILVGGSGLYVSSIIYDYKLKEQGVEQDKRAELNKLTAEQLVNKLCEQHIPLPNDTNNKRRLIRALETGAGQDTGKNILRSDVIVVGIQIERAELQKRLRQRAQDMLSNGLTEETERLMAQYGDAPVLSRNQYGVIKQYLSGAIAQDQVLDRIVISDMHLAKKQLTWWRKPERARHILWLNHEQLKACTEATDSLTWLKAEYKNLISSN